MLYSTRHQFQKIVMQLYHFTGKHFKKKTVNQIIRSLSRESYLAPIIFILYVYLSANSYLVQTLTQDVISLLFKLPNIHKATRVPFFSLFVRLSVFVNFLTDQLFYGTKSLNLDFFIFILPGCQFYYLWKHWICFNNCT